jgi:hypothetical protein
VVIQYFVNDALRTTSKQPKDFIASLNPEPRRKALHCCVHALRVEIIGRMLSLGLAVDHDKRPTLRAVLLFRDNQGTIVVQDKFEVPAAADIDLASQLKDLSNAVTARTSSWKPDAVVVRRADRPAHATNTDGPRFRLMAEGAITAAAKILVDQTYVRTGKDCGASIGTSKSEIDREAASLVSSRLVPACAAALSAFSS